MLFDAPAGLPWRPLLAALAALACLGCASRRYQVSGMVLQVDSARQTLLVSHDRIPGYMEPMIMPFRVRDPLDLQTLQPGARITFHLVVDKRKSYARRLRRAGNVASPLAYQASEPVAVGQPAPDFKLTDQHSRSVQLSHYSGRVIVLNFIYTRCPLPEFCPRLSSHFARLQDRFRNRLGRDLMLLSVSFDPQHDRPEVLAEHARGWKADPDGWRFLTGELPEVRRVCSLFGLDFWPDDGLITHTMRTAVVDRQGRLAANLIGSDFTAEQLGDLVETVLQGSI